MNDFSALALGFLVHFMAVLVIVRFIYYPQQRDKQYIFTFFTFSSVIFLVMTLLNGNNISVGAGFGLFAIFSILRYRTDAIPIREMTYLFVLIALSVVNALFTQAHSYLACVAVNAVIAAILYALEHNWGFHYETRKAITYEKLRLVRPENWEQLLADLRERTGLPITRVEVGKLDFVKDTAEIKIYYDAQAVRNRLAPVSMAQPHGGENGHDDD